MAILDSIKKQCPKVSLSKVSTSASEVAGASESSEVAGASESSDAAGGKKTSNGDGLASTSDGYRVLASIFIGAVAILSCNFM
jgi:hypothetical protein